jgi:hypothetical protein
VTRDVNAFCALEINQKAFFATLPLLLPDLPPLF